MNRKILISIVLVILIILIGGYFIYNANQSPAHKTATPMGVNNSQNTNTACTPNWQCGWGACVNGSQSQVAVDINNCGTGQVTIVCPALAKLCGTQPENLSVSVSIQNFAFNPTPLAIKVGTTVTWTNNDPFPHQIKSNTFNSAALSKGQTFQFTFSTAGQYSYSCAIHPSMHGQIIVTQ